MIAIEMESWGGIAKALVSLIAVVNPLGSIPVFLSVTAERTPSERRRMARITAISVGITLIVSALVGEQVLRMFGITLPAFRVAAGVLVLLMSLHMVQASPSRTQHTPEEAAEAEDREGAAIVPLAIPLLSGPGSMSTVVLYSQGCRRWQETAVLVALCASIGVLVWFVLAAAARLRARLGQTGIRVLTRIMGVFLAAIAIEFITSGLGDLFPGLVAPGVP